MRIVCITKDNTDYAREVSDWLTELERRLGAGKIEVLDPETIEGEMLATAYDVVEYPTSLALDERGAAVVEWRGRPLPPVDEVVYYAGA